MIRGTISNLVDIYSNYNIFLYADVHVGDTDNKLKRKLRTIGIAKSLIRIIIKIIIIIGSSEGKEM